MAVTPSEFESLADKFERPTDSLRIAAAEKSIKDIDGDGDSRVRLLGTIVAKSTDSFVLDDGTGSVRVQIGYGTLENLKEKQLARVIGRVISTGDSSFDLRAEVIQVLESLDLEAWRKVQVLWKKEMG